jgi:hypothetical protein
VLTVPPPAVDRALTLLLKKSAM